VFCKIDNAHPTGANAFDEAKIRDLSPNKRIASRRGRFAELGSALKAKARRWGIDVATLRASHLHKVYSLIDAGKEHSRKRSDLSCG
jgi:hypothetical protein